MSLGVSWNTQPPLCPVLHCLGTRHGLRNALLWRRWLWKCHNQSGTRTTGHPSEAEPPGSTTAVPCHPHGLCCGTEGPGGSSSHRRTWWGWAGSATLPHSLLGNQVGLNPGSSQPGKKPFFLQGPASRVSGATCLARAPLRLLVPISTSSRFVLMS